MELEKCGCHQFPGETMGKEETRSEGAYAIIN